MSKKREDEVFDGFEQANTTPVPDVFFDVLLSKLTGAETKVLLYIIRRTAGFKKTADAISLSQFENGIVKGDGTVLDKGCGLGRETICKALISLEKKGCIKSEKSFDEYGGKAITVYRIRFKGEVVGKSDQGGSRKNEPPNLVGKNDQGSRIRRKRVVGKSDLQETVLQQTERMNENANSANTDNSHSSTPSLSSLAEKSEKLNRLIEEARQLQEEIRDQAISEDVEHLSTFVDNPVDNQPSSDFPIDNATPANVESLTTRNTSTTPNVSPMPDLPSKPPQRNTEKLDPDFPGILRIDGYWQQKGLRSRLPAAKEHWRTLSKCIHSFEDFESLFKHTAEAIKDKQDKHVKPGNMANADILDGWTQERKREEALKEKPTSTRPTVEDPLKKYTEIGRKFMMQGAN